jgi:hypothetical protein
LLSIPILDEKLGVKSSTSVCGSFKNLKHNETTAWLWKSMHYEFDFFIHAFIFP